MYQTLLNACTQVRMNPLRSPTRQAGVITLGFYSWKLKLREAKYGGT